MTWGQLAVNALAAILLVVGTWITARFSRKTGEEANETAAAQARTADWEAFVREQREWTEDRLAERDARIDGLERDMRALRDELAELSAKYRAAIAYVRRLVTQLRRHVSPEQIEPPPPEIQIDL